MPMRSLIFPLLLLAAISSVARSQTLLPGFEQTAQFEEQIRWSRLPSGVRVLVNAPRTLDADRRVLVIYATPNGNTLEQTLGCAPSPERDWHFDIQHVAAQIRRVREIDTAPDFILAVVQAPKLSWPAFRRDEPQAGKIICRLVASLADDCSADSIVLACHSGGGSFVWGYMNELDAIPSSVTRVVFLDSNYSYSDDERHGDKLLTWLDGDPNRRLVVVAYDDREITFNRKKVVGLDGGTFRACRRMLARFGRDMKLTVDECGPFRHTIGRAGQIQFFVHPNPHNKILHTALVGEMNGLIHGLTLGTRYEEKWGTFGGPRAYTQWIQSEPFVEPRETPPQIPSDTPRFSLRLPERPADAPTGSEFAQQVAALALDQRESAVVREVLRGNVPNFLRQLKPISLADTPHADARHLAICFVTSDYVSVGTDDDFFRFPLTPRAAVAIADALGCTLTTPKISDAVHAAADLKLSPRPLTVDRQSVATFYQHHQLIEEQRKGKPDGLLLSGIKKDIVWSNRLREKPHKVAIYGWHYPGGEPIQPLYVGHWDRYVDYSHGLRLMADKMLIDGRERNVADILKDETLCRLISNEGPIDVTVVKQFADWDR